MKLLLSAILFFPFLNDATGGHPPFGVVSVTLAQVRIGEWPISLERHVIANDTSYVIQFRDQHSTTAVAMTSLEFCTLADLKYFAKGLSSLKKGSTGDVAEFQTYSIKRYDVKNQGVWYTLSYGRDITNFKQFECNVLVRSINGLK